MCANIGLRELSARWTALAPRVQRATVRRAHDKHDDPPPTPPRPEQPNHTVRDPVEAAREGKGARSSSGIADAARDMLKRDDRAHAQNLQHS